jgi:hypothetical protein
LHQSLLGEQSVGTGERQLRKGCGEKAAGFRSDDGYVFDVPG